MGLEAATLTSILAMIGQAGGSALGSAFAPSPFQERHSFTGSSADPTAGLTQVQSALRDIIAGVAQKANDPVTIQSTLDPTLPTFTGGGLPFPIGVKPGSASLTKPITIPGIPMGGDIAKALNIGATQNGPWHPPIEPGVPDPGNPDHGNDPGNGGYPFGTPGGGPGGVVTDPGQAPPPTSGAPGPNPGRSPGGLTTLTPGAGSPDAPGTSSAFARSGSTIDPGTGLSIPQGVDAQTYGALQLLLHSAAGTGGAATPLPQRRVG